MYSLALEETRDHRRQRDSWVRLIWEAISLSLHPSLSLKVQHMHKPDVINVTAQSQEHLQSPFTTSAPSFPLGFPVDLMCTELNQHERNCECVREKE